MISDTTLHIGVLTVSIHIPDAQSLKAKRMVLKQVKDRIRNKFNVSVAEIGQQDKWQVAILAFASIGSDQRHVNSALDNLLSALKSFGTFYICEHHLEFY